MRLSVSVPIRSMMRPTYWPRLIRLRNATIVMSEANVSSSMQATVRVGAYSAEVSMPVSASTPNANDARSSPTST